MTVYPTQKTHTRPSVTWCVSANQDIEEFSICSQSPYKQQDTYRMALGRTYRTANAVLPCHKEMCTALLIAYLGSIALAALGGEAWKRSKVERCNSL